MTPADVLLATEAFERREDAAYLRAGLVAATIINTNPYRKRGARLAKPEDFVPKRRREQSVEEMAAMLKAFTLAMGGEVTIHGS